MHKFFDAKCCLVLVLGFIWGAMCSFSLKAEKARTLLVLNSYHEDELWGNSIVQPLVNSYAHIDSLRCDVVYLNGSNVPDSTAYETICNNVFDQYAAHHPDYVIMVGNFAFNLRDRMVQEWGNIPFVLISRNEGFGPLRDYFTDNDDKFNIDMRTPFAEVRDKYNFTFALVPDYPKQTVDMMVNLIPQMKTLVFLADESYVNQVSAFNLYNYLLESYPEIQFKWLKSEECNADQFTNYLFVKDPTVGLLLSSWTYEIKSTRGYPILTTKDLNQISSSLNPVFTMRQAYLSLGCVGGVFTDFDETFSNIKILVDDMLAGKNMRELSFYYPKKQFPRINYNALKRNNLDPKKCPSGTQFINKPQTYFEKYWVVLCIVGVLVLTSIVLLLRRNSEQRKKISLLRRHSSFINNMPVPYACLKAKLDKKGQIVDIEYTDKNKSFEKILEDNNITENKKVVSTDKLGKVISELIDKHEAQKFTYHFDNTDSYFDLALYPVKVNTVSGQSDVTIDLFARDITDNYKMQKGLKESSEMLDLAIDIAKILPYRLDWRTQIITFDIAVEYINKFAKERYNNDHIRVVDYIAQVVPEDIHIINEAINKIGTGEIREFCVQYRVIMPNSDGKVAWMENRGAVVEADEDGHPIQVIGSTHDISNTKEHEEMMAKALAKAEESDRMKSTFLANMSHEIRTPLNAIIGFSSLMIKEKDEKVKCELASVIQKNNDLLLNLVNDVLDLARIESNHIDIEYAVCDINDMIDSICKTMSLRIPNGVKFNTVFYADKCVVEAGSSRISQILINFLTNACKFTKEGSITIGYEIRRAANMLYFFVRDTGLGIAKENLNKVFDQFVKLDSFAQGTGLGLAICKKLVDKMGGEIGVISDGEGYGSQFWFTVPYNPVELDNNEVEVPILVEEETKEVETPVITTAEDDNKDKPLVLVAEDNESNYWLVRHMLASNYRLMNARNGVEAVDYFIRYKPALIIMDINMPEMDGYQAVAEIRKLSQNVPIIAVTAYAFASDRVRILNSGFDAYVAKPVTEITLYTAIANVKAKMMNNQSAIEG